MPGQADPRSGHERFSSRFALILVSLGMAVGVGNIWRFPRVMAKFEGGGGTFLIPWAIFLFTWSIPLLVAESAIGRRTRKGVVASMKEILGRGGWIGSFVALCTCLITCYYAVLVGWCGIYVVESLRGEIGSMEVEPATARFEELAQGGYALLGMLLAFTFAALVVVRGIRAGIERANKILLPTLLVMLVALSVFGLSQEGGGAGLTYMLTVDWETLWTPLPWIEALSQSAWSTGAGLGLILVYATSAPSDKNIVQDSVIIGVGNNTASIVAACGTIPAVFALASLAAANVTPVEVLAHRGPGGTGLAMVWLPRIFAQMPAGNFLSAAFFLVLTFAALTSMIALFELPVRTFIDFGQSRARAVVSALVVCAAFGLPSALSLDFLTNQDWVWGVGLIVSGLIVALAAGRIGFGKFAHDWVFAGERPTLARGLALILAVGIPVQFVVLLGWWFYQAFLGTSGEVTGARRWMQALDPFSTGSVGTCLAQWLLAFVVLFALQSATHSSRMRA